MLQKYNFEHGSIVKMVSDNFIFFDKDIRQTKEAYPSCLT